MNNESLMLIMTGFVIVAAIALVLQFFMLFGMYRSIKALQQTVTPLIPRAQAVLEAAERTIEQSRKSLADISAKASTVMDMTRNQMGKIEETLNEVTSRMKVQMERVELVLDDSISRVHETVATVHNGVLKPVREISGVASGIRAALAHLMQGGRPSVAQATSDEEMFI
jgi:hypothetical protein